MNRRQELGKVDVSVFGSLSVQLDDTPVDTGGPKQRLVLAMLCLSRDGISVPRLSNVLWGHHPPTAARKNIQIYVSKLRRIFGKRLTYSACGYTLQLTAEECDLARFEQFIGTGRDALARGDQRVGTELLERGIKCWRNGPLPELAHEPYLSYELEEITERFLTVLEDWAQLSVDRGDYRKVLSTLAAFAPHHLLRERLTACWMRALSDGGRYGEALAHYELVRRVLRAELGVDPGKLLTDIHHRLLCGEEIGAGVAGLASAQSVGTAGSVVVHNIPPELPDFVARTGEIREAARCFETDSGCDVVLITGPVGCGKTVLAVSLAHRLSSSFPDGQIMLDMTTANGAAKTIDVILSELLSLAGFDREETPNRRRSLALWRSWVAPRRMLLILDGAADENLVRQLLPGSGPSRTIVVGQRRLSGLESVCRLEIGALSSSDSRELLTRIAGPERVRDDDPTVRELLDYCAGWPLAVRMIGSRMTTPRYRTPSALLVGNNDLQSRYARLFHDLTDAQRRACQQIVRLAEPPFDRAEANRSVSAVISHPVAVLESLRESYVLWVPSEDENLYQMSKFFYSFVREHYGSAEAIGPGHVNLSRSRNGE